MPPPVRFRPDVEGAPEIEVVPDLLRGPRVLVAGERIAAVREGRRPVYPIRMADGTSRPLRLVGGFLGLRARFEGVDHTIERRLTFWETFLVVLPLAILVIGIDARDIAGMAVAALITTVCAAAALVAVRASQPTWIRALVAVGATVVGYVVAGIIVSTL